MHERAHEDLALIRRVMEESRREVVDRGKHFLIWGVVSVIGLIATWLAVVGAGAPDPRWVWVGLLAVGWIASMVVGVRDAAGARVRTIGRRLLSVTWVASAVSLTLIGVAGMFGGLVDVRSLPGLMSAVIAAPLLVTSVLTGERWLMAVAAGWWVGGAAMLFVSGPWSLLLMAGMALALLVVPGGVLYARSGRVRSASAPASDAP